MVSTEVEPVKSDCTCIPTNVTAESDPDGSWVRFRRRVCFNANCQTCRNWGSNSPAVQCKICLEYLTNIHYCLPCACILLVVCTTNSRRHCRKLLLHISVNGWQTCVQHSLKLALLLGAIKANIKSEMPYWCENLHYGTRHSTPLPPFPADVRQRGGRTRADWTTIFRWYRDSWRHIPGCSQSVRIA